MATLRQRVKDFLSGADRIIGLVGPSGTGKRFAAQQAARDAGLACVEHDRAQGVINYSRWGAPTLAGGGGLARTLNILCNADCETDFSFVARLQPGCKVVCIANDGQALAKAKITIERVKPLTPEAMAKMLFLEVDWDAVAAKRLSRLAQGDWRQVHASARVDINAATEEHFAQALERMAKDSALEAHPSLRVRQLFSGTPRALDDYARPDGLNWGERNLGGVCETLESMATMQEAAATCDVLQSGGQWDSCLDHFARSAACLGQSKKLKYDYAAFANPFSTPETKTTKDVRESVEQMAPWSKRMKCRLGDEPAAREVIKTTTKTKAKARAPRAMQGKAERGQATSHQ